MQSRQSVAYINMLCTSVPLKTKQTNKKHCREQIWETGMRKGTCGVRSVSHSHAACLRVSIPTFNKELPGKIWNKSQTHHRWIILIHILMHQRKSQRSWANVHTCYYGYQMNWTDMTHAAQIQRSYCGITSSHISALRFWTSVLHVTNWIFSEPSHFTQRICSVCRGKLTV